VEGSIALSAQPNRSHHVIVLVVEDEFFVRQDIVLFLEDRGFFVLEAATAEQAIAMCREGMPVDVLFTDVHLNGGGSGWEVAELFRAARPDIGVVYASGNSADRSRCVAGSKFFNKPYRPADILDACQSLRNT
jgi:CheY-like chemotaxis protein